MAAETKASKIIEALGLLLGMIIGAGLFALPYSFSKSGVLAGSLIFVGVFLISWLMHLLFSAIIYSTPGKHRFPGYIKIHLGDGASQIAFIFSILSAYGAMLAYGILGSIFLGAIFGLDFFLGGVIFFVIGGILFFLSLREVGKINFYLTFLLLAFILVLSFWLLPDISLQNFNPPPIPDWFLPYGILLFAFGGYSALPDLHDVMGRDSRSLSKKIIFWSIFISAIFYLIFIFAVLGTTGSATSEDAILGLKGIIGNSAALIGSIIGILTVFTSYVVFGADLKLTFEYDYKFPDFVSWFFSFFPPIAIFALGFNDLVKILSIVGSVGLGIFAIFILIISWKEGKNLSHYLGFTPKAAWLLPLGILIIIGALQDIFKF